MRLQQDPQYDDSKEAYFTRLVLRTEGLEQMTTTLNLAEDYLRSLEALKILNVVGSWLVGRLISVRDRLVENPVQVRVAGREARLRTAQPPLRSPLTFVACSDVDVHCLVTFLV
jgi:hypothetical protein